MKLVRPQMNNVSTNTDFDKNPEPIERKISVLQTKLIEVNDENTEKTIKKPEKINNM